MSSLADKLSKLSPKQRRLLEIQLRKKGIVLDRHQIPPRDGDREHYPLTHPQQRLWFIEQLAPGNAAYHILSSMRLEGSLHERALRRALSEIVRRHEALRTVFGEDLAGEPAQRVQPPREQFLPMIDLSALAGPRQEQEAERHVRWNAQQPFDLRRGPLLRSTLLRFAVDQHALMLAIHHLVSDGWSMTVFRGELGTLYATFRAGQPSPLQDLKLQYPDYALWQRGGNQSEDLERQIGYWREHLQGSASRLEIPLDRPRPPMQSFRGQMVSEPLSEGLVSRLRQLAQQEGMTLFVLLLSAWKLLLARLAGAEDLVVGTPVANRQRQELEPLIGLFANMLALRTDLRGQPSFRELLRRLWKVNTDANSNQDVPLERILEELDIERNLSHNPLFQAVFLAQTSAGAGAAAGSQQGAPPDAQTGVAEAENSDRFAGLAWKPFGGDPGTTQFDLLLQMVEQGPRMLAILQYGSALFDGSTVRRWLRTYRRLLEALAKDPEQRIDAVPLFTQAERQQVLVEHNDSRTAYAEATGHLLAPFEQLANEEPQRIALVFQGRTLSYGELDARANRLAHHLLSLEVLPEEPVAVAVQRSFDLIVSLYAILKAGAAYVPMDPDYPRERLGFMLEDSGARLLLTQQDLRAQLPEHQLRTVLVEQEQAWSHQPRTRPSVQRDASALAYVIYTSGSTGRPKGAMNNHRAVDNRLLWMQHAYPLEAGDAVLQKTPFSFDVSVWELFWPLRQGARMVLAEPGGHQDSGYLARLIGEQEISTLHFVPSMLSAFLAEPDLSSCVSLRQVFCSGEALSGELAQRFGLRLGHSELHNLYGPTEAAIDVTYEPAWKPQIEGSGMQDEVRDSVPIGRPVSNTEIHLLDRRGRLVGLGVPAELHIGGVQLARGYHRRPALTAERFVPDGTRFAGTSKARGESVAGRRLYRTGDLVRRLSDGRVEFLGRIDHQVKVRGFRIELGEIEAAILAHPQVREAVVLVREDEPGQRRLVAYLVAGDEQPSVRELREHLKDKLPEYMVPALFLVLESLPLTPNGKVDRKALPAPSSERRDVETELILPRTEAEHTLAAIWRRVLKLEQVGVQDSFFELGGDSILSLQVVFQAAKEGLHLEPRQIFEYQTVEELAALGSESQAPQSLPLETLEPFALAGLDELQLHELKQRDPEAEDAYPLSPLQEGMLFRAVYSPQAGAYHPQLACVFQGGLHRGAFLRAWETLVGRHTILRTSFRWQGLEQPLQIVHRRVPLPLVEEDWSEQWAGLTQEEQGARLDQLLAADRARPFALEDAPLIRLYLHRLSDQAWHFLWSRHHLCLDGWSLPNLFQELFTLYAAFVQGREPELPEPRPFRDYVAWLQTQDAEASESYWRERLSGFHSPTVLAIGSGAGGREGGAKDRRDLQLPEEVAAQLTQAARRRRVTLNTLVEGAWALLLGHYSGQPEVLFGATTSGRPPELTGVDSMLGMFINTLPVRVSVAPHLPLGQWLERLQRDTAQMLRYEGSALAQIQSWSEIPAGDPLFEALYVFENAPAEASLELQSAAAQENAAQAAAQAAAGQGGEQDSAGGSFGVGGIRNVEHTEYPFTLVVGPNQGLQLRLGYDAERFDEATVMRALGHLQNLLQAMADADDSQRLADLAYLSPSERQQVLVHWSQEEATRRPPAPTEQASSVQALIAARAQENPQGVAVWSEQGTLSYSELDRRSGCVAAKLRAQGAGPEQVVGLAAQRSLDLVVGMIGILRSGAAYLPLDPDLPAERLAFMLEDSQTGERSAAPLVLAAEEALEGFSGKVRRLSLHASQDGASAGLGTTEAVEDLTCPEHAAYVIYTSGSTGKPKGVVISHGSIVQRLEWSRRYDLGKESESDPFRYLFKTTISFDVSVLEVLVPLASGGTVVVARPGAQTDPKYLLGLMREAEVTHASFTPSLYQVLLEDEAFADLPALRTLYTAAEAVAPQLPAQVLQRFPDLSFVNRYGPTEATIGVTSWVCTEAASETTVPIGRPLAGAEVLILDRGLEPTASGVPGEILLGGPLLARGYLARPALTAERFVPHPHSEQPGQRLYRTGDLGRFRDDGAIEFQGRTDHQVKIRGFRVELGEIESRLSTHREVREAVVVLRRDAGQPQLLVAYLTRQGNADPAVDELRSLLAEDLPDYFLPDHFVLLEQLPLTSSGKVDRRSLPAPELDAADAVVQAPRTPGEEVVVGLFAELLGRPGVGVADDFFALGGHSLLAMQLISRLRKAFSVELPLAALFETPTPAGVALAVEQAQREDSGLEQPPLVPVDRSVPLPVTFGQQRLWFLYYLVPNALYNVPSGLHLQGPLSLPALRAALAEVVRRHEILRTTFSSVDGEPAMIVHPTAEAELPVVDLTALELEQRGPTAVALGSELARQSFDLEQGPLFRAGLLRVSEVDHLLVLNMHHIISDGWSIRVLRQELATLSAAFAAGQPSPLPELGIQFGDYAAWQRSWLQGETVERELAFWRERLDGAPGLLELPTDRPRPPLQTFGGGAVSTQIPESTVSGLRQLAQGEGATLFMAMLAGLQLLLSRYSGQRDLCLGSPSAGRVREELESLVGFFVNTLVYRASLHGAPSFRSLLQQAKERVLEAHLHQDLPFEQLVDELHPERNLSHQPIFQVMFVFLNHHTVAMEGGEEADAESLASTAQQGANEAAGTDGGPPQAVGALPVSLGTGTAKFDLEVDLKEVAGGIAGGMLYNSDLFDRSTVTRMLRHLGQLMSSAAAEPDRDAFSLDLLLPSEQRQILAEWNDTLAPMPAAPSIQTWFEQQAQEQPDAVAVVSREETLTYGELERRTRLLALRLRAQGVRPGYFVGVFLERSAELVTAVLAIVRSGGAYAPMEPSLPAARIALILGQLEVATVLTQERLLGRLAEVAPELPALRNAICMDRPGLVSATRADSDAVLALSAGGAKVLPWQRLEAEAAREDGALAPLENRSEPRDLAYIIFTSGSTGTPKGVLVRHEPVLNLIRWLRDTYPLGSTDRVLFVTSLSFDLSVYDVFGLLAMGGSIRVASGEELRNPDLLVQALVREPITFWDSAPAALQQTVSFLPEHAANAHLRLVFQSGDWIPITLPGRISDTFPRARMISLGGATEATVWSNYHPVREIRSHWVSIPYGRPIENARYHVLDHLLQPCAIGVPGDLFIGGECLAAGYSDPKLTAGKFIPDPFAERPGARIYRTGDRCRYFADGELEFLGRLDAQVKIRGFRIELGEIESVLGEHPEVQDVVVLARSGHDGHKRLVAWVVGREGQELVVRELRTWLAERLPEYMVPGAFVPLPALPLTPNGKLDRKGLPDPDEARAEQAADNYVAPRDDTERALAEVWRGVLRLERVGIYDNFFELGGDSILGLQVVFAAAKKDIELSAAQIFEHQTVAELAAAVGTVEKVEAEQGEVLGEVALAPIQRWFLDQNWAEPHHFNHARMRAASEAPSLPVLAAAVDQLLAHHDILRARYRRDEEGHYQQLLAATGQDPRPLHVLDLSAVPLQHLLAAFKVACDAVQASFDLERGPIVRFALFKLPAGLGYRLLIAAHHLVVDVVSWNILLDDLDTLCHSLGMGEAVTLPAKTTSYQQWAAAMGELAQSEESLSELPYWHDARWDSARPLPSDLDRGDNLGSSLGKASLVLEQSTTEALSNEVGTVYRMTLQEVLIAALSLGLSRWTGQPRHLLAVEGHGRDAQPQGVDISRTMGWFTTMFPMLLSLDQREDLGELLKGIKEDFREIPRKGLGFGLLRYLNPETEPQLRGQPWPQISFNYHGFVGGQGAAGKAGGDQESAAPQSSTAAAATIDPLVAARAFTSQIPAGRFVPGPEDPGGLSSPRSVRSFLLDVVAQVSEGRLRLMVYFSRNVHRQETMDALLQSVASSLRVFVEHSRSTEAGGYTPSDFPLASLDRASLDRLFAKQRDIEDVYPLSSTQQGMLFHRLYDPSSVAYFEQVQRVFHGHLDVEQFQGAWQDLADSHPVLRTRFAWDGLEEPVQIVQRGVELPWEMHDWRDQPPEVSNARWQSLLKADRHRGFNLAEAPLMRLTLVRAAENAWLFNCSYHHILFDGWSGPMLRGEVFQRYLARCQGVQAQVNPRRPYRDYIAWLRDQDQGAAEAHWRQALAGYREPVSLGLEVGSSKPKQRAESFKSVKVVLTEAVTAELQQLASARQTTLSTLVQAAWGLALATQSGRDDVVFGATVSGRSAPLAGMERMIGLFINTLPLRVRRVHDQPFLEWLAEFHSWQNEARNFEYSLLMEVQKWSEVPAARMLFESIVVFENFPQEAGLQQPEEPENAEQDSAEVAQTVAASDQQAGASAQGSADSPGATPESQQADPQPVGQQQVAQQHGAQQQGGQQQGGQQASAAQAAMAQQAQAMPPGAVAASYAGHFEMTSYPLTLIVDPKERLALNLGFDQRLFDVPTVHRLLSVAERLLMSMAETPRTTVGELATTNAEERQFLHRDLNQTRSDHPETRPIHQLLSELAHERAQDIALQHEQRTLSYGDLERWSNRLAWRLRHEGIGPEQRVAILAERSVEQMVAMLAVLKAGAAYLPLDPKSPEDRLAYCFADSGAVLILTQKPLIDSLPENHPPALVLGSHELASELTALGEAADQPPTVQVLPQNLAYMIYTSGSTGQPKAVMIEHRSLVEYAQTAASTAGITQKDRVLQFASLSFDASVEEIFPTWVQGGTLVLRSEEMLDLDRFFPLAEEWGLTVLDLPTAYWHELVAAMERGAAEVPESVRLVILGGERARPQAVAAWCDRVEEGVRLVNTYGPTEATVVSTLWPVTEPPPERETATGSVWYEVPIGLPRPNSTAYVQDRQGRALPPGAPGELCLGGAGLARGYLGRPGLTAERFVPDPFATEAGQRLYRTGDLVRYREDGPIEFLGRTDNQVKIRGFRVELEEIESQLAGHPQVLEAAVVARSNEHGAIQLAAFVSPAETLEQLDPAALRGYLRQNLPAYMIPASIVPLAELPMTASGKVDRNRLPELESGEGAMPVADYVAPRTEMERLLAGLWEELFELNPISVDSDFFDLGGDSMVALRLMTRLRAELGRAFPLAALFERGTIAGLAQLLEEGSDDGPWSPLEPLQSQGEEAPVFFVHPVTGNVLCYREIARALGSQQPSWGLRAQGLESDQEALASIEEMARLYVDAIQAQQPQGPYVVAAWSAGGVVAYEMARQLHDAGHEDTLLVLIDANIAENFPALRGFPLLVSFAEQMGVPVRQKADAMEVLKAMGENTEAQVAEVLRIGQEDGLLDRGMTAGEMQRYYAVFAANVEALHAYRTEPYNGRALFLHAEAGVDARADKTGRGLVVSWSPYVEGGLEVVGVPGATHENMVTGASARVLARRLRSSLRRMLKAE